MIKLLEQTISPSIEQLIINIRIAVCDEKVHGKNGLTVKQPSNSH